MTVRDLVVMDEARRTEAWWHTAILRADIRAALGQQVEPATLHPLERQKVVERQRGSLEFVQAWAASLGGGKRNGRRKPSQSG